MATIPAACDNCNAIFGCNNIIGGSGGTIIMENCTTQCPFCGGTARILDGAYKLINDTLTMIKASKRSVEELKRLAETLKVATAKNKSYDEISTAIEADAPELCSIFDALPKTRTELYAFIAIIIAMLNLLISTPRTSEQPRIEVNQVINHIYNESSIMRPHPQPINSTPNRANLTDAFRTATSKKVGRNDPCLCGSGKKFKKCCIDK